MGLLIVAFTVLVPSIYGAFLFSKPVTNTTPLSIDESRMIRESKLALWNTGFRRYHSAFQPELRDDLDVKRDRQLKRWNHV